jgi:hypothetical protein
MRIGWATAVAVLVGGTVGVLAGWHDAPRASTPPPLPLRTPGVEPPPAALPAVPLLAEASATRAPAVTAATPRPAVLPPPLPPLDTRTVPAGQALILPHGPGHKATLLLKEASIPALLVHEGTMNRDGPADVTKVLRAPTIGQLRGPEAVVELLHLGFDSEARPVVAHVRPVGKGPEGLVVLRSTRRNGSILQVPVRPLVEEGSDDTDKTGAVPTSDDHE